MTRFERLGRLVHRHRWRVVVVWILLLAAAVPFAPQVPGALRAGGFILDDLESARVSALLRDELGVPPSAVVVVYESTDPAVLAGTPAFETAAAEAIRDIPSAPHVLTIGSHLIAPSQVSADRRTAYDVVFLDLPADDSPLGLPGIEERIRAVPGLDVVVAGGPSFYRDVQELSESDLRRAEVISLPLAALALLFVFGSVVAAGVPLVVGGSSVIVALGVIFGLASATPMSIFVLNLATLLGLGLGVDYSLLMTSRFREELRRRIASGEGRDEAVEAAVRVTVGTAGRAVFFSGLTVLLGLIGLILFEFMILRSVGIAGAVVVGLAVAAALTLLPAVLSILGPRIDAIPVRRLGGTEGGEGRWAGLARWVMARPVAVFVPTLAFLLVLGTPFLHVDFNSPDATILPPDVPSRASYDRLAEQFGEGAFSPLVLAIRTDGPATSAANVARLHDYSRRLAADPRVSRVTGPVDIDPRITLDQYRLLYGAPAGPPDAFVQAVAGSTIRGDLATFTLFTPYGANRDEARALVADLRDPASPLAPPDGLEVLVGGGAANVTDVVERIAADFPRTALFILLSKALVMNALSIVASFGALVWIFQDGNLSAILGFQPLGFVETTQPVILFCVLFGLSMDYEVFLLSRMKEAYDASGDNREAVAAGLERSGRIVTSAALIVVLVAGSFAFADIVLIKALGLGTAIAVALDATVVRALLVPATMRLLGDRNWWMPARLERFLAARFRTEAEQEALVR